MLKERRTLVVVPRETPLSVVHLENLTALARAGRGRPAGDAVVLRQARDARRRRSTRSSRGSSITSASTTTWPPDGGRDERARRARDRRRGPAGRSSRRAGRQRRWTRDVARLRARGPPRPRRARRPRARRGGRATRCASTRRPARPSERAGRGASRRGRGRRRGSSSSARSRSRAITGPRGARVRVDWTRCGLELAQVALGFGADELVGPHRQQAWAAHRRRRARGRRQEEQARARADRQAQGARGVRSERAGASSIVGRRRRAEPPPSERRAPDAGEHDARRIAAKVRAGERLSFDDGARALPRARTSSPSAQLANEVRERLHGDRTYFNRNMRIEVTNVCVASCLFCSFAKLEEGAPGAHTMTLEEAWRELEVRMDDPAERDPHRQRPAPRAAVLVLRGAPAPASSASSPTCT